LLTEVDMGELFCRRPVAFACCSILVTWRGTQQYQRPATAIWFDPKAGYGFVEREGGGPDVFVGKAI
jgi:hypothetical protein